MDYLRNPRPQGYARGYQQGRRPQDTYWRRRGYSGLYLPFSRAGVGALHNDITVDGTKVTADYVYRGGDAGATWDALDAPAAGQMSLQGGNPTYNALAPGLGDDDLATEGDGSAYWKVAAGVFGDIADEDWIIEGLILADDNADTTIISKQASGVAQYGIYTGATTNRLRTILYDGSATVDFSSSIGSITPGYYHHFMLFGNMGWASGLQWYINGAAAGTGNPTTLGSLTNANALALLSNAAGSAIFQGRIAHVAMWKKAAWLADSAADWALVAAERFYRCCGIWPAYAHGTAAPQTAQRATVAHLEKLVSGERKLVPVGAEWMRCCQDIGSSGKTIAGYKSEQANTNLCDDNRDLTGAAWTKLDVGDTVQASTDLTPIDGKTAAGEIIGDATDGIHGVSQAITLTANSYLWSVWAKKGDQDFLYLDVSTIANVSAYFDLNGGTVETVGASATAIIRAYADGWYRCTLKFTGTAASHTHRIMAAPADADNTFAGDGSTPNIHVDMPVSAIGIYPTSPMIVVGGAGGLRNKDELAFNADNIDVDSARGRVNMDVLYPDYNVTGFPTTVGLNDTANASGERIEMFADPTDAFGLYCAASGGATQFYLNGGADIADDDVHHLEAEWRADYAEARTDGEVDPAGPDLAGDPTDSLNDVEVGMAFNNGNQPDAVIGELRIERA